MPSKEAHQAIEQILSHECQLGQRRQSVRDWIAEYRADEGLVLLRVTAGWNIRRALAEPLHDTPLSPKGRNKQRSSRFLGVVQHGTRKDRWYARINIRGETVDLGTATSEYVVAALFNIASRNRDGLRARINLI